MDVPNGYSSHGYNGYDGGLDTQGFDYSQNAYGGSGGGGGGGNMWGEKMHVNISFTKIVDFSLFFLNSISIG